MQEGIVCLLVSNYLNAEQSVVAVVVVTTVDIDIYKRTSSLYVFHSMDSIWIE